MAECFAFRSFPYHLDFKSAKLHLLNVGLSPRDLREVLRAVFGGNLIIIDRSTLAKLVCVMTYFYKAKNTKLVMPEFIFAEKASVRSRMRTKFWRIFLSSVDKVVVFSDYEVGYYAKLFRQPPQKFHRIYYGEDMDGQNLGPFSDGYVFASGRTDRDFVTLLDALRNLKVKGVIVADGRYRDVFREVPGNVEVYFDVTFERYKQYLMNSRLVVIPLAAGASSRGQSTIVQAKKYGKPILCADLPFSRDCFFNDFDGMIYYAPGNVDQLRDRIGELLSDSTKLKAIGECNYLEYMKYFNIRRFTDDYESLIMELTAK